MKRWERVTLKSGKIEPYLMRLVSTQFIYLRRKYKGRIIQKNTGEKTVGLAKIKAEELFLEERQKISRFNNVKTATFREVTKYILRVYTPTLRIGTQEMHKIYFEKLNEVFGDLDVNEITEDHFLEWVQENKRTQKRKTYADYAKHLSLVMRFAYKKKLTTHRITFSNPDKKKESNGRYYTDKEISALWKNMSEETRDQMILCFQCMMRLREALYLTWDRVDLENGKITLRPEDVKTGSKTGKGRVIYLNQDVVNRLRARKEITSRVSNYVFPSKVDYNKATHSNKKAWLSAKLKAGIKGRARWHDLRHSGITRALFQAKENPLKVSQYAGVSIRVIERVYLHAQPEFLKSVGDSVKLIAV